VLFLLDHDVDAAVGRMLRQKGHGCHTASEVGLASARDDALTVWASQHSAVLVSTDKEFGQRRMKNAIGKHVWLRCLDWEASDVLAERLGELDDRLQVQADITVRVSKEGLTVSLEWS
jgi:predicted nuclease of predicted toxin-antitoxin system